VTGNLDSAYRQARRQALWIPFGDADCLRLTGPDSLELLHRMSTNDLAGLTPGQQRQTVFTDALGRVLDIAKVLAGPSGVSLLLSHGRLPSMQHWLANHIFFQDDVTLTACQPPFLHWAIYGPSAAVELSRLLPKIQPLPSDGTFTLQDGMAIWPASLAGLPGWNLLVRRASEAAARLDRLALPEALEAFEVLRVEAGMPAVGKEILSDSIPLEVGLRPAISFTKGCYIGQEIIARMDSRGRQAKALFGLRLPSPAAAGSLLRQDDRRVGTLTSLVHSPALGWIGLATVRPQARLEKEGSVLVGSAEDTLKGQLVDLPFSPG
jgi:folate-binding protein YgfZ